MCFTEDFSGYKGMITLGMCIIDMKNPVLRSKSPHQKGQSFQCSGAVAELFEPCVILLLSISSVGEEG